jgi:hypothetical protein
MNHLVFLEPRAMELEKILSGVKTMIAKEFKHDRPTEVPVRPGDSLYFLRNKNEYDLRVKATVVHVASLMNGQHDELSHTLKEMQPKLQLNEEQFQFWSTKQQILLVEFDFAHKIDVIHVAKNTITDRSDWTAFEELGFIT